VLARRLIDALEGNSRPRMTSSLGSVVPGGCLQHRDQNAMIDRLVSDDEVISLKGDSYGLKDRDLGRVPAQAIEE
jgi:hypothetical protein